MHAGVYVQEIQARSELGHDRLGREAVADGGRRRARGRVEAQHASARAGDLGVGGVARHERAQRRRAVGEGGDDRREDAAKNKRENTGYSRREAQISFRFFSSLCVGGSYLPMGSKKNMVPFGADIWRQLW